MYNVTIQRLCGQRTNDETIKEQVEYVIGRALTGNRGAGWRHKLRKSEPIQNADKSWLFEYKVSLEKVKGKQSIAANQFELIKDWISRAGMSSKFGKYPWFIVGDNGEISPPSDSEDGDVVKLAPGVREVADIEDVKTWADLLIPNELLTDPQTLRNHPCFSHIYGRDAQIRIALSALKAAIETEGLRRGHCVFYGHAGCGKTTALLAIEKLLGDGAILRLDATSTTKAGLEKLFFFDLKQVPPVVIMEEVEKANEDALKIWLGALDDRGEIRKVNFRGTWIKEVKVVFLCTVNNYSLFKKMMGSDGKEQGALASRCVNHIYFPRPDDIIMRQILHRDISQYGGKTEWIEPALKLAKEMEINDPRQVLSFLAGGDRLIDEGYQLDRLEVYEQEQEFMRE